MNNCRAIQFIGGELEGGRELTVTKWIWKRAAIDEAAQLAGGGPAPDELVRVERLAPRGQHVLPCSQVHEEAQLPQLAAGQHERLQRAQEIVDVTLGGPEAVQMQADAAEAGQAECRLPVHFGTEDAVQVEAVHLHQGSSTTSHNSHGAGWLTWSRLPRMSRSSCAAV